LHAKRRLPVHGRRLRLRPVPSSSSGLPGASALPLPPPLVPVAALPPVDPGPASADPDDGAAGPGSGRTAGGWNTTGGGWNTAAGTLGLTSPAPRPPAALSSDPLSYSSLSSIRAISSQAPGRAVSRRSARWRRIATHPHVAREHVVNVGPGGAALAALSPRGYRAGSTAPSHETNLCLRRQGLLGYGSQAPPRRHHDPPSPANRVFPVSRAREPCISRVVSGGNDGTMPSLSRSAVKMSSGRTAGTVCRTTIRRMAQSS